MITAFQSNAFQNNAFQIGGSPQPPTTTTTSVSGGGGGHWRESGGKRSDPRIDDFEIFRKLEERGRKSIQQVLRELDGPPSVIAKQAVTVQYTKLTRESPQFRHIQELRWPAEAPRPPEPYSEDTELLLILLSSL